MALKQAVLAGLGQAMKARDTLRVSTLRLLKAAIKNLEVELKRDLEEGEILRVLRSQAKQRKEAIRQFRSGGRDDLADKEAAELDILMEFLPQAPSAEAVENEVKRVVEALGAKDMKDMGVVMKTVMSAFGDSAEGTLVNKIVKKHLMS